MGDWMAYACPREEDKKSTCVERLDVWFSSDGKVMKRVTFRRRSRAEIKDILDRAKNVVELFKFYDNFEFAISDEEEIEEGRMKWHKVADGDLPKKGDVVLNEDGDKVVYTEKNVWEEYSEYYEKYIEVDAPIAWCEVPRYTEG